MDDSAVRVDGKCSPVGGDRTGCRAGRPHVRLPVTFEPNVGQVSEEVAFLLAR